MARGASVFGLKTATPTMSKLPITIRGKTIKPIHPGRILKREMLARDLSANKLSLELHLPSGLITQIVNGKRGISEETALRLSRYFGNSSQFWINLQSRYDMAVVEENIDAKIDAEVFNRHCFYGKQPP